MLERLKMEYEFKYIIRSLIGVFIGHSIYRYILIIKNILVYMKYNQHLGTRVFKYMVYLLL